MDSIVLKARFIKEISEIITCVEAGDVKAAWKLYDSLTAHRDEYRAILTDNDYAGMLARAEFLLRGDMGRESELTLAKEELAELLSRLNAER